MGDDEMIGRVILTSLVAAMVLGAGRAEAQAVYDTSDSWGLSNAGVPPGPYLKVEGGHDWTDTNRFDNGWAYGGGVGYRFFPWFRADATFDYRGQMHDLDANDARFHSWAAMLNGYVDVNIPFLRPLVPYVGAGVGVAQNSVGGSTVTVGGTTVAHITGSNKNQFAWQAMAGASYYVTPRVALDVSYRFFEGGDTASTTATGFPTRGDFGAHEVIGAIRFGF